MLKIINNISLVWVVDYVPALRFVTPAPWSVNMKTKGRKTAASSQAAHPDHAAFKTPSLATHPSLTYPLLTSTHLCSPFLHTRDSCSIEDRSSSDACHAFEPFSSLDLKLGTQYVVVRFLEFPTLNLPRLEYIMRVPSRSWPLGHEAPSFFPCSLFPLTGRWV